MDDYHEFMNMDKRSKHRGHRDEPPEHYYGDIVRLIFLACGVAILLSISLLGASLNLPFLIAVTMALVLAFLAGYTSPQHPAVIWFDLLVAYGGAALFQFWAVFGPFTSDDAAFWIHQGVAIALFLAAYFATKTYRFLRDHGRR